MPARPKVGAQIRRARQLLNMRQQDLADKLGVSRSAVDAWENDRSYPQRNAARLEEELGVSLGGGGEHHPGLADLGEPRDEWEAAVMDDADLPDRIKQAFIRDSRAARAAYKSQAAARRERERTAGRHRAAG